MTRRSLAILAVAALAGAAAEAEILDASPSGFTVESRAEISAPPAAVWTALVERVGAWWSPDHTFSGDASRLSIEPRPGGCFCETLDGGGVRHLQVVYAEPGRRLRLVGGLGPLQGTAASGPLTFELASDGDAGGTRVILTYAVAGYSADGLGGWAKAVDGVLAQQLGRLERFVESGRPDA